MHWSESDGNECKDLHMKDGRTHDFPHEGRAGGSYTKRVIYEGCFVIVEDEWRKRVAFPADAIERVEETPDRSW
jgi:hypothetical protein